MPHRPSISICLQLIVLLPFLFLLAFSVTADEVFLNNGRVLSGTVVEQSDSKVVIDVAAGRLSLPMSMIERVEAGASEVSEYQKRASALAADDVAGWLRLAFWAKDERLDTRSKEALAKVVSIDPKNILAREMLDTLDTNAGADATAVLQRRSRASRRTLDQVWSGAALAPNDEALAQRLDEVLSLARYGRWAESAWRLRQVNEAHSSDLEASVFATVLFAVDLAAHSSNTAIEDLFTPGEVLFERLACILFVKFDNASPVPWEFAGNLDVNPDTVDLSGGRQLSLVLPFRRAGQRQHLGTTDRIETPVLFEGRFMEAPKGGSLLATWRTDTDGSVAESHALLEIVGEANGGSWGEVRSVWKEDVANYRKHQDLDLGFFHQRRFVRTKMESERISFDVEGGFTESLSLPASERMFLDLAGDGDRAAFDWISISGPIDGLWLARRLAVRAYDSSP